MSATSGSSTAPKHTASLICDEAALRRLARGDTLPIAAEPGAPEQMRIGPPQDWGQLLERESRLIDAEIDLLVTTNRAAWERDAATHDAIETADRITALEQRIDELERALAARRDDAR